MVCNYAVIIDQQPPEKIHHRNRGYGKNQLSQQGAFIIVSHKNPNKRISLAPDQTTK